MRATVVRGVFFSVVLSAVALVAAVGSGAAAAATVRPHVVSFSVTPSTLPANGARVTMRARVTGRGTCSFYAQGAADQMVDVVASKPCHTGTVSAQVKVLANPRTAVAKLSFAVVMSTPLGTSARKAAFVRQAAGTPPVPALVVATQGLPDASVTASYSATLAASGGTAPYTWALTAGTLPAGVTLAPTGAIAGAPTSAGAFSFTVAAHDALGKTATATFAVIVAVPLVPGATSDFTSSNWSGYAAVGGPFTAATGTFTVPAVTSQGNDAEWVGIGGVNENDLIQAGVAEGINASGGRATYAWWEILPDPETLTFMPVAAGDSVTVSVGQVVPGTWKIAIFDATNGQSFTITRPWSGAATSAEWVVEAPSDATGQIKTLAAYTPTVTFTALNVLGTSNASQRILLRQAGSVVSTPSSISPNGFAVSYGATAPAAP